MKEPSQENILFKLSEDRLVDENLMKEWSATIQSVTRPKASVMVDASAVPPLSEADLRLITKHLGDLLKAKQWELQMLCPRETEDLLGKMGLDRTIRCFHVHVKARLDSNALADPALGDEAAVAKAMRQEISYFFAHLSVTVQRISKQLFGLEMIYRPPLENLGHVPEPPDGDIEHVLTLVESPAFSYVVLFQVGVRERNAFAGSLFKGMNVPEAVLRDLVPEFVNNCVGNLKSQFSVFSTPIRLQFEIPRHVSPAAGLGALPKAGGKSRMHFNEGDLSLKVLVGYSLKA